jgi:regulator of protease activity HflC (stomatin/prohibitin superfamily)
MADQPVMPPPVQTIQLGQTRVPLHEAAAAFDTPDVNGRTPIIVIPTRPMRLRLDLLGVAAALLLLAVFLVRSDGNTALLLLAIGVAGVLAFIGASSALLVRVPEGTAALLVQAGRHLGVLGPGSHLVMPWIAVSHLVTRREIPFELPRCEAPTHDNVTARLDLLITFVIADPARFVYSIAASDFDLVMQGAGHDSARTALRQLPWAAVLDMGAVETEMLRGRMDDSLRHYGVEIRGLNVMFARPNEQLMAAEESRELAVAQRAEAAERHVLAERRLQDEQALARVRLDAGLDREHQRLIAQAEQAEMRQRISRIEAETLGIRLQRLEELLREFPRAAEWEWQGEQLGVVRALASNTRAVVQFGQVSEAVRSVLVGTAGGVAAENGTATAPAAAPLQADRSPRKP